MIACLGYKKAFNSVPISDFSSKSAICRKQLGDKSKNGSAADRNHHVPIAFIKWTEVFCGIPQGSVLGPAPFLIYVNDRIFWSHVVLFVSGSHSALFSLIPVASVLISQHLLVNKQISFCLFAMQQIYAPLLGPQDTSLLQQTWVCYIICHIIGNFFSIWTNMRLSIVAGITRAEYTMGSGLGLYAGS